MKSAALPIAMLAAVAALVATSPASAVTCTPTAGSLADSTFDADAGLAPEIASVDVAVDAACSINLSQTVLSLPATSDFHSWWIDSDNSTATGATGFAGADYIVSMFVGSTPTLSRWQNDSSQTIKSVTGAGDTAASLTLADLGVSASGTIRIYGASMWSGSYSYYDFVPNSGGAPLAVAIQVAPDAPVVAAPPVSPPPPVIHTAPSTQPSAPVTGLTKQGPDLAAAADCVVPKLKGLSRRIAKRRLAAANCALGSVSRVSRKGFVNKVVGSAPRAGTTLASGALVDIALGKKPRKRAKGRGVGHNPMALLRSMENDR